LVLLKQKKKKEGKLVRKTGKRIKNHYNDANITVPNFITPIL